MFTGWFGKIKCFFDRRAYDARGLAIDDIQTAKLSTVADIAGSDPDFTGNLDSVEYVRRMRVDGSL